MDFSVSHRGKSDVSQHDKSAKHKCAEEVQKHAKPSTAFVTTNVSLADQVTKPELKMSMLCTKINVALSFCNDFNRSVADMFPDSDITLKYLAGGKKVTQLIKGKT